MSRATEACALSLQQRFGPTVLCDVSALDEEPAALWPAEQAAVAQAVPARRREFAAGRAGARRLLARLGLPPAALPAQPDRSPAWPSGVIGSIGHSAQLCVVAATRLGALLSLGVDVEPDAPLEDELWDTICSPRERAALERLPPAQRGAAARLHFCAKEAVYKCLHPVLRLPLEFHDVELEWPAAECFRAHFSGRPSHWDRAPLEGFVLAGCGSLIAGLALPLAVTGPLAATRPPA